MVVFSATSPLADAAAGKTAAARPVATDQVDGFIAIDGKGNKKEEQDKDSKGPKDPDETPEERARRILQENADLEKGPLTPGRREFRPPEKDW